MTDATPQPSPKPAPRKIAPPTGTRDFYPQEMLLRRYITDAWRRTSLRHGFDEIDGPTFESAELYKVKSGEGILGEMFGVYSGKSPDDVESVKRGEPPFGLRPEFTPTLARMYAARAKQLPQPTKWFCVSNFFRAERPQRGRLREFFQWNCDVIGGENPADSDVETLSVGASLFEDLGLVGANLRIRLGNRSTLAYMFRIAGVPESRDSHVMNLLDKAQKVAAQQLAAELSEAGISADQWQRVLALLDPFYLDQDWSSARSLMASRANVNNEEMHRAMLDIEPVYTRLHGTSFDKWTIFDLRLARGLAYYTGNVFEVQVDGERAVAGGGRYDNLIELFGGPPTPACGFGMGDVVLANLLADRKLVPEGRELLEALSRPMPVRPDAFVIASPNEHCDAAVVPLVARLRRGVETERYAQGDIKPWSAERYHTPPLHARRSYKATKNVGKLLADASACHARFAVIVERFEPSSGSALEGLATVKNLGTQAQEANVPLQDVGAKIAAAAI